MESQPSNSQKVLKGISSQTAVTLAQGIVEIVSFSIMSRLLTKEDFGYYAAMMAIVAIFASFSETGIGAAIIQKKELTKKYVDNAFTLSFIFGLSISLSLLLLSGSLADAVADRLMAKPLKIMSVTLLLHCLTSVFTSLMYRRLEFLRVGCIQLVSLILTTIVAIWLAYKGYGYYAIIIKGFLQSLLVFSLSYVLCKMRFSFAIDIQEFKAIFRFSGWLMASVLFRNLAHQVDKLLMPRLLSISALGAYNRPKDFIEQISTKLNGIFDTAMFPVLSGIQDNREKLQKAFRHSLYMMNLFAALMTLAFALNSGLIIKVFLGDEWIDLTKVMIILSFTLVFNIDGRLADCYLRSMGMTKEQFYFRIFETAIKIVGVLASYSWGITGIAVSIVVTNTVSKLIKIVYISLKVDVSMSETLKTIVSSWKFTLFIVPICMSIHYLLPECFLGDIIQAIIFVLFSLSIFLFFPNVVGQVYIKTAYPRLISMMKNKLRLKL